MARIRTVKPEFFRSPSTAKATLRARILYQAMWCWADDFGIGETNIYGLLGFAFPDSDQVPVEEIPRLLKEIQSAYEVMFYENRGRYFYAVTSWDEHQKTERRAAKRNPGPDHPDSTPDLRFSEDEEIPRQSQGNSEQTQGKTPIGTGEQGKGNRGNFPARATEVCHQSTSDVAPPPKCSRHLDNPDPPSCGGCAAARRALKEWHHRKEQTEQDDLEAKRSQRQQRLDAIADCPLCDENGNREINEDTVTVCGHQAASNA